MLTPLQTDDPRALRVCLRDVVALATLPAMWSGAEPLRIAESLAASLFTMLGPELVFVAMVDGGGGPLAAVAQTGRYESDPEVAAELQDALLDRARSHDPDELLKFPDPRGGGMLRLAVRAIGHHAEFGVVAIAFPADGALPTAYKLMMSVGATQAATAVQNAQLLRSMRKSEDQERKANCELAAHLADLRRANADRAGAEQALREARSRLEAALTAGEIGTFVWDVIADRMYGDRNFDVIFGIRLNPDGTAPLADFVAAIHPDDREPTLGLVRKTLETGCDYKAEYRITTGGRVRWVIARGKVERDTDGRIIRFPGVLLDITDRKRAEEARQEITSRFERQSRLFEGIASTTPDFIYVLDLEGRFVYANRPLLAVWGRTFEEAVGKNVHELGYPQWHADMHMRELRQVIDTKRPIKGEVPFTGASGFTGVYEYIFSPVLGPDGQVEVIAGTTRDVTERKRAEREVDAAKTHAEASLARWQAVIGSMTEGVVVADAEGNLAEWNPAALEMHGYGSLDKVRTHLRDFPTVMELTSKDGGVIPLAEWPMSRALRGESFSGCEVAIRRLDADLERVISYSGKPVRDRDGRIALAVLTLHDITERKRAEEALKESEARFRAAFEQAAVGIAHVGLDGRWLRVNERLCAIVGYQREELSILGFQDITHPDDLPTDLDKLGRLVAGEIDTYAVEKRYIRKDGTPLWINLTVSLVGTVAEPDSAYFVSVVEDISLRKQAEEARSLSEHRFQRLVEQSPLSTQIFAPDGSVRQVNAAWERLWGITLAEYPDYNIFADRQLADRGVMPLIERAFRGEAVAIEPIPYVPDRGEYAGQKRWCGAFVYPVKDRTGRIEEVVLVHDDVTERKRAEDALLESEATFRQMANTIPQLAWMARPDGWIFWYNDQWHRYTGTTPQQMEGWGWQSVHDPKMLPSVMERWQASINTGQPFEMEFPLRSAAGEFRWFLTRVNPLHGSDGKILLWFGTNTDVSEQRKQQEALAASEARLRAVVEATPECVKIVAPDGSLSYMNAAGLCMIEADELASVSGASVPSLIGAAHREQWQANHKRVCGGEKLSWEFEIVGLRGTRRSMETHAVPLPMPDGRTAQLAVTRDITQRKQAELQRESLLESERAARAEAERASRMKDEFLATLSHELRTPLNAILGWSQILRVSSAAAGSDDDLAQGLATIERNARTQAQIIEDLLDMSRIISGKVRLDVQRIDLPAVIEAALLTAKPGAEAKNIRLQPVLDPLAGPISGDPNRLQQVFWNLLSNAVKFTPRGGRIQVLLERVNSHLEVSIIDSGEGIPPEFLPFVFDRFRQADASTTRRHGGLGLGLAIVKQLVELHGGTVRAMSAGAGEGSTFIVTLPLTVVHHGTTPEFERRHPTSFAEAPSLAACQSLEGVRVLLVDDEPDARALLRRLLTDCKAEVTTAGSPVEALAHLEQEKFDVLVSDIGMPGEDGYSLIRGIRKLDSPTARIPAIALTAYARSEDRQHAILAGFHLHIAKPVEPSELITMVSSLASRRPAGG